ncbi:MFS transporter [Jannaschia pohangensis]|uniref:MFS-type transporter involved in bile tolerance, Atg22 family n=1 Tax=Jannaschia pohangensis TaxID=390807 RepID=A0A1I3U9S0_9RHOB|nr:MFS transporter [Jannaschia pohangensis]SFJ80254.1 MFS-type transporter involved in bile tolerance, Atg22 family [Jannaschia pohangensis]
MSLMLLRENRNYRWLMSASAVSNLGDGVSMLAFPWLASLITRDPFLISLTAMAGRLPWFLFTLPAGVWTDRVDRRKLMIRADLFRFAVTLGVVFLVLAAPPPVASPGMAIAALCAVAFLLGSAEVLRDNAAQTVLPSVVRAADLEAANGQMWTVERVTGHFIGPPLAGLLIAMALPVPFAFDAATFALAATCVWLMVIPARIAPARRSFRVELREGLAWIWGHVLIWRLAIMLGVINACSMASLTMLVLFSQDILGLGAVGHGLLLTAGAVGGVAGGLLAPGVARRWGPTRSLRVSLVAFACAYALIGVAKAPWVVALALAAEAGFGMLWNVVTVSFRQRTIPDALLGRVNSVYRFFGWGMMPLGAIAGGLLVSTFEPTLGRETALRLPYLIGGGIVAGLAVVGYLILRMPDADNKP